MITNEIKFSDGAGYERYMGKWSQLAGEAFLDWLRPEPGLHWLDVGCGNGAFTERIMGSCAPASVDGIDPSEEQLSFARARPALRSGVFRRGDVMALPFPDQDFDAAVMPLVIFFVPDPAKGVAEMARVVCTGGLVCAYAWDMLGGGFPYATLQEEMCAMGIEVPKPPRPETSRIDALRDLWSGAGLQEIQTRAFTVQRTFPDFEDYWAAVRGGPSVGQKLADLSDAETGMLQERMRVRLRATFPGPFTLSARCHAVRGNIP